MKRATLTMPAVALLAAYASGQVGPGLLSKQAQSLVLSQSNFDKLKIYRAGAGSKSLRQVSAYRLGFNGTGVWTVCMTVNAVDAKYGNTTLNDSGYVIMGFLDEVAGTFKPVPDAAKLNDPTGGNFGLTLYGRLGEHAVLDRGDGVYYAKRASHVVPFPVPNKVQGITQTYVDPALGLIDGKLNLIYVEAYQQGTSSRSRIVAQELDVTTPAQPKLVASTTKTIADVSRSGPGDIFTHSPTPILDSAWNVHGLFMAERVGNDSDMYLKGDLDPNNVQQIVVDSANWLNNGSIGSGRLYFASSSNIDYVDTAWLVGDAVPPAGTARLLGAVWDRNTGTNWMSVLWSTNATKPIAIGGIGGEFALNLSNLILFGLLQHSNESQRAEFKLVVPNDVRLRGFTAWMQGITIDPKSSGVDLAFTNTTTFRVK